MITGHHKKIITSLLFFITLFSFSPAANAAVPAPPAGLAAIAGNGEISLTWGSVAGATSYILYRSQTSGGPYNFIARTVGTAHTNRGLTNGTTYHYVATALNTDGQSPYSGQVSKAPLANTLPAPTGITAIPGNGQISLSWTPVTSAVSYNLFRATSPGGPYTPLLPSAPGPSFTDRELTNGTPYFYIVQTQSTNSGAYSEEVSTSPSSLLPLAPATVTVTPGSTWAGLSWSPSAGATGYAVYRATTTGGPYAFASYVTGTAYEDFNLSNGASGTAGMTYYYVVAAVNANGRGAFSAEANALVSPNKPPKAAVVNATRTGSGEISLSWGAPAGAVSYAVYRSTSPGASYELIQPPQTWNGFTDTGLTNGTPYYYVVDTHNQGGVARSDEVAITPVAQMSPPANVVVIPGNAQATVTWNPVAGATGYYVTVSNSMGAYITSGAPSVPNFTATNLTSGFRYYFRVQAAGAATSGFSSEVSAMLSYDLPLAPVNLSITPGNTEMSIRWDAVDGATGYKVYRRTEGNAWPSSPLGTVTGTLFNDRGLVDGKKYYYAVAAFNGAGDGAWSPTPADGTPLATTPLAPTNIKAIPGNTQTTVTWDPVVGATGYYVTVANTAGGAYISGGAPSTPSFTVTDLTNTSPYYFRIQAAGPQSSSYSSEVSTVPSVNLPLAPVNLSITPGNTEMSVRWDAVDGATGYRVYRRTGGSAWPSDPVATVTATLFTDRGLTNSVKYQYLVSAVLGDSAGAWSPSAADGTPTADSQLAPTNIAVVPGNTQATITWDPVAGATGYYVTVSGTPGGNYIAGGAPAAPSFTATDLTNTSPYYFRVQVAGVFNSSFSSEVNTIPSAALPLAPVNLTITAGNAQLSIRWDAVNGATSYRVYRRTDGGAWSAPIGSPAGTIFTDTGLIDGTKYYYSVAAVNANGAGAWSPAEINGTPTGNTTSAPIHVAVTPGNTLATVTWDPVAGATAYYVTVATSPGGTGTGGSGNTTGTIFTATNLNNGQPYYFRVQAAGNQLSAFSAEVSATPNPAANVGNISGHVALTFAGYSDLSVQNATVSLQGTQYSAATDSYGNFTMINIPFGNYNLIVNAPGMDAQTVAVSLATPNLPVSIPQMVVSQSTGIPGDANGDHLLGIDDVIYILQVLTKIR